MTIHRIWAISVIVTMVAALGFWLSVAGTGANSAVDADREVSIVIDANFSPFIDDEAIAGENRVTLENDTTESFGVSLYFVPDDVLEDLAELDGTPEVGPSGLPVWLDEATPVGGPGIAGPGSESEAFVDLDPGSYVLLFTFFPLQAGGLPSVLLTFDDGRPFVIAVEDAPRLANTAVAATATRSGRVPTETDDPDEETAEPVAATQEPSQATEEPSEATEEPDDSGDSGEPPPLTATIVMTDGGFQLPASFAPGPQTWEIVNQGQVPHALIVVAIPDGTTSEQLLAALFPGPERTAAAFDTSAMINVGGLGPLAPGLSAGATFDLSAGTYAMFSALPDPVTGQPDGAQGLLTVFVVG